MSAEMKRDGAEPSAPEKVAGVLADMFNGVVIPHKRDEELLRFYGERFLRAWRRDREELELFWSYVGHKEADAEWKDRLRKMTGNVAAMREALEKLFIHFMCDATLLNDRFTPLFAIINHALASPPRNCDRFDTKEEAAMAFAKEKKQWIPQQVLWELAPWLDWLFATETKGATDGSK